MVLKWSITIRLDEASWCARISSENRYSLVSLVVSH